MGYTPRHLNLSRLVSIICLMLEDALTSFLFSIPTIATNRNPAAVENPMLVLILFNTLQPVSHIRTSISKCHLQLSVQLGAFNMLNCTSRMLSSALCLTLCWLMVNVLLLWCVLRKSVFLNHRKADPL